MHLARIACVVLCFFALVCASPAAGAGANAGFVSGVWYSHAPFFAGETVRIYAAVQNRSGSDLTGTVVFYDGERTIGTADFSALDGRLIEVWTDWTAAAGPHEIRAVITRARTSAPHAPSRPVFLQEVVSPPSAVRADTDTDGDRTGDADDSDDDNDRVPDTEEIARGTDPKDKESYPRPPEEAPAPPPEKETAPPASEGSAASEESAPSADAPAVQTMIQSVAAAGARAAAQIAAAAAAAGGGAGGAIDAFADRHAGTIAAKKAEIKKEIAALKRADTNRDGRIDILDFNTLMVHWGREGERVAADLDGDRRVGILDFNMLMVRWTG